MAAIDELKKFKQGKMTIVEFAPRLMDIMLRAQIYTPDLQLDYFKDRIRQELRNAVIYGRAKTIEDAIEIATEFERDLWKRSTPGDPLPSFTSMMPGGYGCSTGGSGTSGAVGEAQQNYQQRTGSKEATDQQPFKEKRRCYKCGNNGHLRKDCRKKKSSDTNQQNQQTATTTAAEKSDSEDDIFRHFLNQQDSASTTHQGFYLDLIVNGRHQQALLDTGSTISSISLAMATGLGLQMYKCERQQIKYGNNSLQETDTRATMDFRMEGDISTQVRLLVVDDQNEAIILGMDWLALEDLWLHPRTKKVMKMAQSNSMEVATTILDEFPRLTTESAQQSITNAPYQHRIDTGDALPVATPDYRRSAAENLAIKEEVQAMLEKKVIVPSNSDWCSPVVLIKKPNGSYRFCVDYRRLKKVTIKDKYPLPRITELLDKLQGSKYFSTIDLKSGYWQLPMDPKDAKKTAFVADGALYEFTCLPFGVVNGPASFMRFMHGVLRSLNRIMVYLDDVIVFSTSLEQHKADLRQVLDRLDEYNLKISVNKCQLFLKEVKFLGFLVSGSGIRPDPASNQVIKTWPTPSSVKKVQQFMGTCAFYHKFISNLSTVARPLYQLLKKTDKDFTWTQETQAAFDGLKKRLMELPTLAYPDPSLPYDLHTDASDIGVGAVLVQGGRPISYASRTLSSSEQNYNTTERE
ncbi:hypothetical protein [Absidia glauca]|uniref:Reverse transcriptase domain-containing protein n=1 Tax=Absidia glauca TaxID=4829 RepID=A0A168PDK8_ABSGL|nr:hypothetical protein [Absidia glauca]